MIVATPPEIPLAIPVDAPIVAIAVLLLVHEPPPASVSVDENPAQAIAVPDMGEGNALTVKVAEDDNAALQENEFVIEVKDTVVEPELFSDDVLNVPVPPLITKVAVLPVAELAPLRLYVTVYVPATRLDEETVTVVGLLIHTLAAALLTLLTLGSALTVAAVV